MSQSLIKLNLNSIQLLKVQFNSSSNKQYTKRNNYKIRRPWSMFGKKTASNY